MAAATRPAIRAGPPPASAATATEIAPTSRPSEDRMISRTRPAVLRRNSRIEPSYHSRHGTLAIANPAMVPERALPSR